MRRARQTAPVTTWRDGRPEDARVLSLADGDTDELGGPFRDTQGRGAVSYMIRNTQQQLVALSGQADLKASILITASSVVITVGLAQAQNTEYRVSFAVLAVFLLGALLAAVLCVLPSFSASRRRQLPRTDPLDNLLFFGDFSRLQEHEFLERMGRLTADDAAVYEAQVRDLYRQGAYLLTHKYRFLRAGYVLFLCGFLASAASSMVQFML